MLSRLGSHNRQLGGFTAEQPQTGAYVSIAYRRCLRVTGKPDFEWSNVGNWPFHNLRSQERSRGTRSGLSGKHNSVNSSTPLTVDEGLHG